MVALRAKHMHELAVLNGTLKEFEIKCLNCGRLGHQTWQCGDGKNITSAVICNACGGVGHLSKFKLINNLKFHGTPNPPLSNTNYSYSNNLNCF